MKKLLSLLLVLCLLLPYGVAFAEEKDYYAAFDALSLPSGSYGGVYKAPSEEKGYKKQHISALYPDSGVPLSQDERFSNVRITYFSLNACERKDVWESTPGADSHMYFEKISLGNDWFLEYTLGDFYGTIKGFFNFYHKKMYGGYGMQVRIHYHPDIRNRLAQDPQQQSAAVLEYTLPLLMPCMQELARYIDFELQAPQSLFAGAQTDHAPTNFDLPFYQNFKSIQLPIGWELEHDDQNAEEDLCTGYIKLNILLHEPTNLILHGAELYIGWGHRFWEREYKTKQNCTLPSANPNLDMTCFYAAADDASFFNVVYQWALADELFIDLYFGISGNLTQDQMKAIFISPEMTEALMKDIVAPISDAIADAYELDVKFFP